LAAPVRDLLSNSYCSTSAFGFGSVNSFAVPLVCGALALMKARFPNDSYQQLINRLLSSVDVLSSLVGRCKTGGRLNLYKALTSTTSSPPNDSFAQAFTFAPNPVSSTAATANNVGATKESGEPNHAGNPGGKSVWWSWTPDANFLAQGIGQAIITTKGSSCDTLLAIYTGNSVGSLTAIASNDDLDASHTTSAVRFSPQAGVTYRIAVDGKNGATGAIELAIKPVSAMPPNDLDGDGYADLVFEDATSYTGAWFMGGAAFGSATGFTPYNAFGWQIVATGDFNSDGSPDLAFQYSDGSVAAWLMDGWNAVASPTLGLPYGNTWPATLVGTGDFDEDGQTDLLLQFSDGSIGTWYLNGVNVKGTAMLTPAYFTVGSDPANWKVVGTGNFNGDKHVDIIFQHADGRVGFRLLNGASGMIQDGVTTPQMHVDSSWRVVAASPLTGPSNATSLIFQQSAGGQLVMWAMSSSSPGNQLYSGNIGPVPGGTWRCVAP
jgi:hypothetical protein